MISRVRLRPSKRMHVFSQGKKWAVMREGTSRASKLYIDKETAIRDAEKMAEIRGCDVVVHKRDGSVQSWKKSK